MTKFRGSFKNHYGVSTCTGNPRYYHYKKKRQLCQLWSLEELVVAALIHWT